MRSATALAGRRDGFGSGARRLWPSGTFRRRLSLLRLGSHLVADPLSQPDDRLRLTGDKGPPFLFRQSDGDDAISLDAHEGSIRTCDVPKR